MNTSKPTNWCWGELLHTGCVLWWAPNWKGGKRGCNLEISQLEVTVAIKWNTLKLWFFTEPLFIPQQGETALKGSDSKTPGPLVFAIRKELSGRNEAREDSEEQCRNSSCLFWFLITQSRGQEGKYPEWRPGSCQHYAVTNHRLARGIPISCSVSKHLPNKEETPPLSEDS